MKKLVVWYNPTKNLYYYRVVRGIFYEGYSYEVGAVNSFGHIIVLVISFNDLLLNYNNRWVINDLKTRVINCLISFLKKLK